MLAGVCVGAVSVTNCRVVNIIRPIRNLSCSDSDIRIPILNLFQKSHSIDHIDMDICISMIGYIDVNICHDEMHKIIL